MDVAGSVSRDVALAEGFDRAFLVGAGFALAGAAVALVVLAPRRFRPQPEPATSAAPSA